MPLYLARHPHLGVSLVKAKNETELRVMLDQFMDPTHFEWKEYRGPVLLTFRPPVAFEARFREDRRPITTDEFELRGVKELAESEEGWHLDCEPEGDEGFELQRRITAFAFPETYAYTEQAADHLSAEELESCMKKDIVAAAWRDRQRGQQAERQNEEHLRKQAGPGPSDPPDDEA